MVDPEENRETNLSASSRTSTSSSFVLTTSLPFPRRNSSIRPGVPIIISAPVSIKRFKSCAGEDSDEEIRRSGSGYVFSSGGGVPSESETSA